MSRGSRIISFRIDDELLKAAEDLAAQRNERTREAPWTRTDFILKAIAEKVAHSRRSRQKRAKKAE